MKKKSIMVVLLAMSMIASVACSPKKETKSKNQKKSNKESAVILDDEDDVEEPENTKKQKATESEKKASTTKATETEKETEKETSTAEETETEETMPANPANLQFVRDESVRPHISGPQKYTVGEYVERDRTEYTVERIVGVRDGKVLTNYNVSNRCKILNDTETYYEILPGGGYLIFNGSFDYHGTQYQYELKLYPHISDVVQFQKKTGIFDKVTEDGLWIKDLYDMTICDCVEENINGFLVQYLDEEGLTPEYLIEHPKMITKVQTKVSDAMYFKTDKLASVVCSYDIKITG
ncbi:MAG: hypothetical protein IKH92_04820 [Clostridiales bacterium]|nr:hypothetical protein [Clostridiales bacterium]